MKDEDWRRDLGSYAFTRSLPPRFTDVDPERHINNVCIQAFYIEARMCFQTQVLGTPALERQPYSFRPVSLDTEYFQVAHYPEPLKCGIRLVSVDEGGYTIAAALFQNGQCVGAQQSRIAAWKNGERIRLPEDVRSRLEGCKAPPPSSCKNVENAVAKTEAGSFPLHTEVTTRYGDFDADGCLSQVSIAQYMEEARTSIIKTAWGRHGADLARASDGIVIARVDIHNMRPSTSRSPVWIGSGITRIGRSSFTVHAGVFDSGGCVALADCVIVRIMRESGRPLALSADLRQVLEGCTIRLPRPQG